MESAGKGHLRQQENCILRGEKGKFCGRIELYDASVRRDVRLVRWRNQFDPKEFARRVVGGKDFLLTNPDKFRDTKEKFGHRKCREDMWAKYINRLEELCKGLYIGENPI